ncbi:B3 domain-containing transcription factor VRN1-like [Coffea arabica]|uniref:B3 domain-containing transcription factor VRN1-like n=1 Tax=Coffea arabica TaxID=13443 RepID=A0A6P6THL6_COFAR|nr:B3 domain-containing transcription factor VRN1-like [Coffea arabica]
METNQRCNKRSYHQTLNHQAKKSPHFFKVVFSPVDQGIKIPTAFMRQYGDSLEKVVWLKVPNGASWPVDLLQTDAGTWLDKGWKDFAEYYSIEQCYFVVFRYDEKSLFNVIIFDLTASEIEYPLEATQDSGVILGNEDRLPRRRTTSPMRNSDEMEKASDDDSIEILEEIPAAACHAKQGGRSAQIGEEKASACINKENVEKLDANVNPSQRVTTKESFKTTLSTQSSNPKIKTVIDKDKFSSYQRAEAFTSENPFFIRFMQPSYVTSRCALNLRLSFALEHLTKDNHCNLDLRVSEGTKTWPVICFLYTTNAKITHGWEKFVLDNNLVVGDVCVFELIRGSRTFIITIYRRN